jgi:hydroxyacylglutathione hydrolase
LANATVIMGSALTTIQGTLTMDSTLHGLPVLQDNVIWIWVRGDEAVVVDPAEAAPVHQWIRQRGLRLTAVLQTHHHADHIGGTPALLVHWPEAAVVAAAKDRDRIPFQTVSVADGDVVTVLDQPVQVLDVAAHTSAHIAFFVAGRSGFNQAPMLFCGDTLFSGGCGRLFEGTAADMHRALQRLAVLPGETKVCCAHEYTEANLRWAAALKPTDPAIAERQRQVIELRKQGDMTLPSSIALERRINLFLQATSIAELARLRRHKDHWRAP